MKAWARGLVSGKKRRYQQHGFDLDLSYVTERVIALGFPAEGAEGVYRNPLSEVARFLRTRHAGHFRVYNLCSERGYDIAKFDGNVECFPFDDHQPASTMQMTAFCHSADTWLSQHPENIIAVHCKAGKGRTGLMVCAYLLYSGMFSTPADALAHYGDRRTKNGKGVTIASQRRYLSYFYDELVNGPRASANLRMTRMQIAGLSNHAKDLRFAVTCNFGAKSTCDMLPVVQPEMKGKWLLEEAEEGAVSLQFADGGVHLAGDVKVQVFERTVTKERSLFYCWFNTSHLYSAPPDASTASTPPTSPSLSMLLHHGELDKVASVLVPQLVLEFKGGGGQEDLAGRSDASIVAQDVGMVVRDGVSDMHQQNGVIVAGPGVVRAEASSAELLGAVQATTATAGTQQVGEELNNNNSGGCSSCLRSIASSVHNTVTYTTSTLTPSGRRVHPKQGAATDSSTDDTLRMHQIPESSRIDAPGSSSTLVLCEGCGDERGSPHLHARVTLAALAEAPKEEKEESEEREGSNDAVVRVRRSSSWTKGDTMQTLRATVARMQALLAGLQQEQRRNASLNERIQQTLMELLHLHTPTGRVET